jgi:hypothetical protein
MSTRLDGVACLSNSSNLPRLVSCSIEPRCSDAPPNAADAPRSSDVNVTAASPIVVRVTASKPVYHGDRKFRRRRASKAFESPEGSDEYGAILQRGWIDVPRSSARPA